jgi:biotin transport system substrate-specific component
MEGRDIAFVSLFAALTAVGAFISIPLGPVPFTLQVLFVLLSGAILGAFLGALSQVVYLLLGVIGLPVFAGGTSGIGHLFGPTGGYLFGFVFASFLVGLLSKSEGFWVKFFSMLLGILVIHFLGVLQLSFVAGMSFKKALLVGSLPFFPFDTFKAFIASGLVVSLHRAGMLPFNKGT